MLIIVTNKYKELIANSVFKKEPYKCASGYFNSSMFVSNLESFDIENLIVDVTAVREPETSKTWEEFKKLVPPNKLFVLLDANKQYNNPDFFAILVRLGIYNFSKDIDEIAKMMVRPKTLEEVEIYLEKADEANKKREIATEKYDKYEKEYDEKQEEMQEYIKKSQEEGFEEKEIPKFLNKQLIIGGVHLPLMTFIFTAVFFALTLGLKNILDSESFMGQFLFTEITNTGFNMIVVMSLMLVYLFVLIYFIYLDEKIKKMYVAREKFIIIPFAMLFTIIFTDYHVFGILSSLMTINDQSFLFADFGVFAVIVVGIIILGYYFKLLVANSKKANFEKAIEDRLNIAEVIMMGIILIALLIPVLNKLFVTLLPNVNITEVITSIADSSAFNLTFIIAAIILNFIIIAQASLVKKITFEDM